MIMRIVSTYRVNVNCLYEVRLPGSERMTIKLPHSDAVYHLYHSGAIGNAGRHGVAIALSATANAAL